MNFIETYLRAMDIAVGEKFYIESDDRVFYFSKDYELHNISRYVLNGVANERDGRADSSLLSALLTGTKRIRKLSKKIEELQDGDLFYTIDSFCDIKATSYGENHSKNKLYGNAFTTEQEAKKWLESQRINTKLKALGAEEMCNKEKGETAYIIAFDSIKRKFVVSKKKNYILLGCLSFKTEEEALNAIEQIGEITLRRSIGLKEKRAYTRHNDN